MTKTEKENSFPTMVPRDITTSSAALIGLVITALGILVTAAEEPQEVIYIRNFSVTFIGVIILFVLAVLFTSLSSLLKRELLWKIATTIYTIAWAFLGVILIVTLIGYAYGIQSLQFHLPQFDISLITTLSSLFSVILMFYQTWRMVTRVKTATREIKELLSKMPKPTRTEQERIKNIVNNTLKSENEDVRLSIVKLRMNIEEYLSQIADLSHAPKRKYFQLMPSLDFLLKKKIISKHLSNSIKFVWNTCSKVVHGIEIPVKDARIVLNLGGRILLELMKIENRLISGEK